MIMNKRAIFFFIILFLILISCSPKTVSVVKVIDGDTVILSTGEKVRYIGINAPEMGEPFYMEAKRENRKLVLGKEVELEFDREERDQYKRLLAYIFVGDTFVNYELLWEDFHKYSVRIERINYNAEGRDEENLNGEYVVLKNISKEGMNLPNFRIKDESHNVFVFPEGSYIDGEGEVVIYTGKGFTGNNKFYWDHKTPVWNNDHDTVYLMDIM